MQLPKHLIIEEYIVEKGFTMSQIIDKINVDYPQYDILGPLKIRNPKGNFKYCYFNLKINLIKNISSTYGI